MTEKLSLDSEIFTRAVEEIITKEELERLLKEKKQIRVKLGIDATAPELHIGHAVNLWKIRVMQEAGHKAVIIYGDFTTTVGDPTGRVASRPKLAQNTIEANLKKIKKEAETILLTDKKVYEPRRNSEWFGKMKAADFMGLLSLMTHARLIERDMFQKRIKEGADISMEEMIYPILQGYDSVAIESDLTIIGRDQTFNEHVGRRLQEKFGARPQVIVANKLLPGLGGGEKMSKSLGNYIALGDSPTDKFGKTMRVLDELIVPYLEVYTDVEMQDIRKIESELQVGKNPMEAKLFLAEEIVRRYHGAKTAKFEREKFLKVFSQGELPKEMPEIELRHGSWDPVELLVSAKFASSKSEARRLIRQGGVEMEGKTLTNSRDKISVQKGFLIKVGKRKTARIK